ncbi:MAG: DUF1338 domain-containing protein [Planctomycetota bacterium]
MPSKLDTVYEGLIGRYRARVPAVGKILVSMCEAGIIAKESDIENDHVAFRTMGVPNLGIASLEKIFLHFGYTRRESYHFAGKKLDAFWYAPPEPFYPRIFVSELRVTDLSENAQKIIHSYTDEVQADPVDSVNLEDAEAVDKFLHSGLWRTPTLQDYQTLASESEYAAWVIYNRYYLNHFTISVHNLPAPHHDIEAFNAFLEGVGVQLNDAGGKIKISPDGLLLQSSTVAEMVIAEFDDGAGGSAEESIAGSYVEFAERKVLPEFEGLRPNEIQREHRRDGFEAGNADKIFESTFSSQTNK